MDISTGQTPAQVTCAHCQRSSEPASAPCPVLVTKVPEGAAHLTADFATVNTLRNLFSYRFPPSVQAVRPSRLVGRASYSRLRIRQPISSPLSLHPASISEASRRGAHCAHAQRIWEERFRDFLKVFREIFYASLSRRADARAPRACPPRAGRRNRRRRSAAGLRSARCRRARRAP